LIVTGVLPTWLQLLVSTHGAWAVGVLVGLESLGLPLPGETALIAAAIYAGTTGQLSITGVLAAALLGAIIGDSLGYLVGRKLGWRFMLNHGQRVGLTPVRFHLGRALFLRHGGKVVFFGRFVAFLRVLAASLSGALGMAWPRFLLCNASGAVVWVSVFGGAAYGLGTQAQSLFGPLGIAALTLGIAWMVAGVWLVYRAEARFLAGTGIPRLGDGR
jgi:membrane protein DedA with SNARE-associated domain